MTNLHAETQSYRAMRERLIQAFPELGEDDQALIDTLDGCTSLTEAIAIVLRSADEDRTMAAALKIRIDELDERRKRLDERHERKRAMIAQAMQGAELRRVELAEATITLSKGKPSLIVTDEAAIPAGFWIESTVLKLDKAAVREAMNFAPVPGVTLGNAAPILTVRRS